MKKTWRRVATAAMTAIVLAGIASGCGSTASSSSAAGTESTSGGSTASSGMTYIAFGSASAGGGFFNGASAIAQVLNTKMGDQMQVTVETTGASAANAALVHADECQLGMCATEVAYEAYHGTGDFEGDKQCADIRTVLPGWSGVYMFNTLADSGYQDITDLSGSNYSGGPEGSSNQIFTNRVFDLFQVNCTVTNLPSSDASRSLGDGTIDGFSLAHPASAVTELEASKEVKILLMTDDELSEFEEAYPMYPVVGIPAGYYKCLPDGGRNPGLYNTVICNANMDEDTVYNILTVLYDNIDTLQEIFPSLAESMNFDHINDVTIPYHPGAVKFFEEHGVTISSDLAG